MAIDQVLCFCYHPSWFGWNLTVCWSTHLFWNWFRRQWRASNGHERSLASFATCTSKNGHFLGLKLLQVVPFWFSCCNCTVSFLPCHLLRCWYSTIGCIGVAEQWKTCRSLQINWLKEHRQIMTRIQLYLAICWDRKHGFHYLGPGWPLVRT